MDLDIPFRWAAGIASWFVEASEAALQSVSEELTAMTDATLLHCDSC